MQRWLCDAIFVLKYCLSSLLTRCEPTNYCRWVKAKNRNSVLCARARAFSRFLRPCFLRRRGCRTWWGRWVESSPISQKNAQGLSRLLLLFSVGTTSCERAQGRLGDCAALFLRGARRALLRFPSACALREVSGSWPNNGRLKWAFSLCGGRNGLEIHCDVRKIIVVFLA